MQPDTRTFGRTAGLICLIVTLVSAPFVIWGDSFVLPLLEAHADEKLLLGLLAIALLAADAFAPVPATLVIMFLAGKAGWITGILGGTLGLSLGVLVAAWVGRAAVGRIAPRLLPEKELARLRAGLTRNPALSLACWRAVPVMAETSVMLAAAAGMPTRRIFRVTLLPNFIVSAVYSFAADDSLAMAALAFLLVMACSLLLWVLFSRGTEAVTKETA